MSLQGPSGTANHGVGEILRPAVATGHESIVPAVTTVNSAEATAGRLGDSGTFEVPRVAVDAFLRLPERVGAPPAQQERAPPGRAAPVARGGELAVGGQDQGLMSAHASFTRRTPAIRPAAPRA